MLRWGRRGTIAPASHPTLGLNGRVGWPSGVTDGEYWHVQALRKIFRALGIVAFFTLGCWLIVDAAVRGPGEYQLCVAALLLVGALGLIATWFWSPFG
jgi:hypothetical protein